ncbi:Cupredoxin [Trametes punicea]|nr:Cupredoxin [Trametes punicea]
MRFSALAAALLPVGIALAQTDHIVQVGANGTLTYNPPFIQANNGDTIHFQFLSKNHTVTQSTFAAPCSNITDANGQVTGVDSGFQFVPANATQFPVWSITVNNASAPLWFFCRQANHCQSGMVFAVNPTQDKSYDAFKANAAASNAVNGSPQTNTGNSTAGTAASASGSGAAPGGASATAGAVASGSAPSGTAAVASGSGSTPSPSASATSNNGAGAVHVGAGAMLMTLAGLSFGLLL